MNKMRNACFLFSSTLMAWGFCSVIALSYTVYIITRLSLSFFVANGMISHPEVLEAIYYQVFDLEPIFFFMLLLGFAGVATTAFIFSSSQFNYFKRLGDALAEFSLSGPHPNMKNLGPFNRPVNQFIEVVNLRMAKKGDASISERLAAIEKEWPLGPHVSWMDQIQFAAVSTLIAGFFTMLSLIFFWKVTDRLVELSGSLIRYKVASGPSFFNAQTEIVTLVMWTVFSLMIIAFGITGFRFGNRVSQAHYAVLRDLRKFMQGDFSQRVVLRNDDPAQVLLPQINEALARIAERIKG